MGEWRAGGGMWTGACGVTTFIMAAYFINTRCKCDPPSRKHFQGLQGTSHECTSISLFLVLLIVCCVQVKKVVSSSAAACLLSFMQCLWGAALACWGDCCWRYLGISGNEQ